MDCQDCYRSYGSTETCIPRILIGCGHTICQDCIENRIKDEILHGCNTQKPGWVRLSLHPTITNDELQFICNALKELAVHIDSWSKEYVYDSSKNDFLHKEILSTEKELVTSWFS